MDSRLTQALAVWGAVLSTFAIAWQVFLWLRSNPRIAVRVQMNEGHSSDVDDWISFELRNRGGKPTTVEEIMFVQHRSWWSRITRCPDHVEYVWVENKKMLLPVVLQPGMVWKGSCLLDSEHEPHFERNTRRRRFEARRLFYRIRCAHTDRLIAGIVKPETFLERM